MQNPILVFDHIHKTVTAVPQLVPVGSPAAQALADQRNQVTTSGSSAAR
jgi:hypothetical protein